VIGDSTAATGGPGPTGRPLRLLQRIVEVRTDEVRALLWAGVFFFCILSSYYIFRPLREEMGVAGGVWNLPWLFTGTLVAMLVVHPPFAWMVARLVRRRFVTLVYRFFALCLLVFYFVLGLASPEMNIWIGRVFYIWTAVFSLFTVSVFWGFMADVFDIEQGKRLFGFIGMGGTLGGLAGSGLTAVLAVPLGTRTMLVFSLVLLEGAVQAVKRLDVAAGGVLSVRKGALRSRQEDGPAEASEHGREAVPKGSTAVVAPVREARIGGSMWGGITHLFSSPYLLGIALFVFLYTILSTVLYMQQASIVERYFVDRAVRTAVFARIDFVIQLLTVLTQFYLTGRIIRALGVGLTLALLPILSIVGFAALGMYQTFIVFAVFQVLRRSGEYAVVRPARETLYTVVSREDKYKAKNLIDTVVYRTGDWLSGMVQLGLNTLGWGMAAISFLAVPLAGLWLMIGLWLGVRQKQMAARP
jgi:AAA family ATP:ADP antiporter